MRRGIKRIAGILLIAAMLAVIVMLLFNTVFVVRNVTPCGDFDAPEEEVIRTSGILPGTPLRKVDEAAVENEINSTGTLKFESMKLRYPCTVEICVSSRKPAAMLMYAGNILVLDAESCVVDVKNQVPNEDLIYISDLGVTSSRVGSPVRGNAVRIDCYKAIMEAIEHHDAGRMVSEINFESTTDICIITRSGVTVRIGNCDGIRDKIAWMKAVVADIESRGEKGGVLDVSVVGHADYRPAAIPAG